ncbi:MAG: hypothetical protein LC714_06205 [Actinobacteria bacterium]|nr:hypothetical protein [Actinomycetota bacterium]
MKHFASPEFWERYRRLPAPVRDLADKNFELLKNDPRHPSLHFKRVGRFFSVRVGLSYRALGVEVEGGVLWFWIGSHADYDKIVG